MSKVIEIFVIDFLKDRVKEQGSINIRDVEEAFLMYEEANAMCDLMCPEQED